jgi:hypothetical protein
MLAAHPVAVGLGLLVGCALAVSACGGGGSQAASTQQGSAPGSSQPGGHRPGQALAAAYEATRNAHSAKITITGTINTGAKTVHTTGHGTVQFQPPAFDLHTTAAGQTSEERLLNGTAYLKTPEGQWRKLNVSKLTGQPGAAHSPTEALSYLRGASDKVTTLGPATIKGVHTTGYTAIVDLGKVAAQAPGGESKKAVTELEKLTGRHTLPITVWLDGHDRLVREKNTVTLHIQGKPTKTTSTTTLTDYGIPVHVTKPPTSQITSSASVPAPSPSH